MASKLAPTFIKEEAIPERIGEPQQHGRTIGHGEGLRDRLIVGDVSAAKAIGLDVQLFLHPPPDLTQATIEAYVRPMVERAAFAMSVNEAWALLSAVALAALVLAICLGKPVQEPA